MLPTLPVPITPTDSLASRFAAFISVIQSFGVPVTIRLRRPFRLAQRGMPEITGSAPAHGHPHVP
jgi:hypothetical protein